MIHLIGGLAKQHIVVRVFNSDWSGPRLLLSHVATLPQGKCESIGLADTAVVGFVLRLFAHRGNPVPGAIAALEPLSQVPIEDSCRNWREGVTDLLEKNAPAGTHEDMGLWETLKTGQLPDRMFSSSVVMDEITKTRAEYCLWERFFPVPALICRPCTWVSRTPLQSVACVVDVVKGIISRDMSNGIGFCDDRLEAGPLAMCCSRPGRQLLSGG